MYWDTTKYDLAHCWSNGLIVVKNFHTLQRSTLTATKSTTPGSNVLTKCMLLILLLSFHMIQMKTIVYSEPTIEVTKFQVPTRALVGRTNRLICQYHLKGLSLHAMKLYKDNNEFYRYLPPNRLLDRAETKLVFEVLGVYVDERRSNASHVFIGPLTKQSSGNYKCQVVVEDTFKSVSVERRMEVVSANESQQQWPVNGRRQSIGSPASASTINTPNTYQQQQQNQANSVPPSSFFKQEARSRQHLNRQTNHNNNNNNIANHHMPSELASSTSTSTDSAHSKSTHMATIIIIVLSSFIYMFI